MATRPILRLKGQELVAPEDDRLIPISSYQALLPCRNFDVTYKVATLSNVSPTLEFFLRIVKSVPGISVQEAASFFGLSDKEIAYVVEEATSPGYVDLDNERAFLTNAGEELFTNSNEEPLVSEVKTLRRKIGFDLYSISPERKVPLDGVQLMLPELPIIDEEAMGKQGERIKERFRLLFREITEHSEKSDVEKTDLYSIDEVHAGDRFLRAIPIVANVRASAPSIIESVDLSGWHPEFKLQDRREVETSAFRFVKQIETTAISTDASAAYDILLETAPLFLKDYAPNGELSVNRYWRDAVRHSGELRRDRMTIPMVGSLGLRENVRRIQRLLDLGIAHSSKPADGVIFVAPQVPHWAASPDYPNLIRLMGESVHQAYDGDGNAFSSSCIYSGEPEKYIERIFRKGLVKSTSPVFPRALEVMLVPGVMVVMLVHSPVGAAIGFPVPLGLASFDEEIVDSVERRLAERVDLNALRRSTALQPTPA